MKSTSASERIAVMTTSVFIDQSAAIELLLPELQVKKGIPEIFFGMPAILTFCN